MMWFLCWWVICRCRIKLARWKLNRRNTRCARLIHGIHPDIIIARSDRPLDNKRKEKLAFQQYSNGKYYFRPDIESIYDIPINFEKDGLSDTLLKLLKIKPRTTDLKEWRRASERLKTLPKKWKLALGKYFKPATLFFPMFISR